MGKKYDKGDGLDHRREEGYKDNKDQKWHFSSSPWTVQQDVHDAYNEGWNDAEKD